MRARRKVILIAGIPRILRASTLVIYSELFAMRLTVFQGSEAINGTRLSIINTPLVRPGSGSELSKATMVREERLSRLHY